MLQNEDCKSSKDCRTYVSRLQAILQWVNAITAVEKDIMLGIIPSQGFVIRSISWSKCCWQKQDEAGVILTDEQNDFLVADASRMEEIEELNQLLEASLKHDIELCVLLNHECVDKSLQDELKQVKKKSLEIQEGLKARIKILDKDVQRCEKQSVDFELKFQHEKKNINGDTFEE
ncbi:hypothetical protein Tco_1123783 [Tanacetum coccineum]|uniref:Uncharacterized protein n=1 Tax=Tanacetum coccineum TaxID=301880 RepID=A0ABQ5J7A8_9ASTR